MRYARFVENTWHPSPPTVEEGRCLVLPAELELQALWFSGAFGRDFTTKEGQPVKVVQFGEWNRGAGPDFHHALVAIDGKEHHGFLELDPHTADWENHRHAVNPAYRDVVLHVSFRDDGMTNFIRNDEHRMIPQVLISAEMLEEALQRPRRETAIAKPGRCLVPLREMAVDAVSSLLREAAEFRAGMKAKRFLQTASAHGRDAALFQAVAQTLGYRSNALPMLLLGQRSGLKQLRESPDAIEAILFGSAGFLSPDLHEQAEGETRDYLRTLWEMWWKVRAAFESIHSIPWQMHGQRPANHPHRRVATLVALAGNWNSFRKVALARPFSAKKVIAELEKLTHPFWNFHHTLASQPSATPIALFGKARALELIANHLAPLALQEDPEFSYEPYAAIRSVTNNEKLRRVGIRLFGSEQLAAPWQKCLAHQQALLQIYHDFCLEDLSDCDQCPFPQQLAQWQP